MNPDFWRGKSVLLTGHTGFKGSWLTLWLQQMGAKVTGLALPPVTEPSLFKVARVGDGMTSVLGDIGAFALVLDTMQKAAPEIVFHLAAQSLVRYSYRNPVETYQTNVMGTVHLLEATRNTPSVRAVISVTSDKAYENREWVWSYREQDPMGGHDPYSNSKGCAELVTAAFRSSYFPPETYASHGVALASARAGNVIGGGDWAEDRLVPDILRAIGAREAVNIRSPHAVRPWQHVLEPLAGYGLLAEMLYRNGPAFAEPWNFGPSDTDARPVEWIVDFLTRSSTPPGCWTLDTAPQPHEAHYLKLDSSKARQRLGWQPRWSLEEALRRILAWQEAFTAGADMRAHTLRDIADYSTTAER
ncbi:CDP-glucose 4,6-dehydratase [Devosia riboflavina]